MSYDIFIQFHKGKDFVNMPKRDILKWITGKITPSSYDCTRIEYDGLNDCEIYMDEGDETSCVNVHRPCGSRLFDDILNILKNTPGVLYFVDIPGIYYANDNITESDIPDDMLETLGKMIKVSKSDDLAKLLE
jgi:hypothetical protein